MLIMYVAYLSLRIQYSTGSTGSQPAQITGFAETGYTMQEVGNGGEGRHTGMKWGEFGTGFYQDLPYP